jgi:hypothetical protein
MKLCDGSGRHAGEAFSLHPEADCVPEADILLNQPADVLQAIHSLGGCGWFIGSSSSMAQ